MRKKNKWCQVEAKQMWHGAKGESWQETVTKVSSEHRGRACESVWHEKDYQKGKKLKEKGKRMKWQNPETRPIWYSACKLRMGSVYHLRDADALDQISTSSVIQNTISQPGNHPSNRHSNPQWIRLVPNRLVWLTEWQVPLALLWLMNTNIQSSRHLWVINSVI